MDVSQLRTPYKNGILREEEVPADPFAQFKLWFREALENTQIKDPNAMCLSTCTCDGKPSCRYVLMKSFDEDGFTFYTNHESRKGREMSENPHVSALFFWQPVLRQVRIEGIVKRKSDESSVEYFKTRPKTSQASAFISKQSQVVGSRSDLESEFQDCIDQYDKTEIPKPVNWGGYLIQPSYFEFWQGHTSRLHDRVVYKKDKDSKTWQIVRLYP
jgi:pyridoxamine 5'-phosphate oxidase